VSREAPLSSAAPWAWWEAVAVGLVGLALGTLPAQAVYAAAGEEPSEALGGVGFAAIAAASLTVLAVLLGWLRLRHPGWPSAVRPLPERGVPREATIGVAAGVAISLGASAVAYWVLRPVLEAIVDRPVAPADQIDEAAIHGAGWIAFVLAVVVVAPVVEELFFRGLVYRALRGRYGVVVGAVGSVALFGLTHAGAGSAAEVAILQVAIGLAGLGFTLVYELRGTLVAAAAAHATFNLVTVVLTAARAVG
jgi:membrane protease YdiL (CAAX protease family)